MKVLFYNRTNRSIQEVETEPIDGKMGQIVDVAHGIRSEEEGHLFAVASQLLEVAQFSEKLLEWASKNFNEQVMPTELVPLRNKLAMVRTVLGKVRLDKQKEV